MNAGGGRELDLLTPPEVISLITLASAHPPPPTGFLQALYFTNKPAETTGPPAHLPPGQPRTRGPGRQGPGSHLAEDAVEVPEEVIEAKVVMETHPSSRAEAEAKGKLLRGLGTLLKPRAPRAPRGSFFFLVVLIFISSHPSKKGISAAGGGGRLATKNSALLKPKSRPVGGKMEESQESGRSR